MLKRSTEVYTAHTLPLECDIYATNTVPDDAPAVLFFHAGGLVNWNRQCIPPWLVQICYRHGWILMSPSYRLLPQSRGPELLQDATAAYDFARTWGRTKSMPRDVILCGASGGFFLVALILNHYLPPPLAVLSIAGINTFRHPFFNSSTLLVQEPIHNEMVTRALDGPVVTGTKKAGFVGIFHPDKLTAIGSKNVNYVYPPEIEESTEATQRGLLYEYLIYKNQYLNIVGNLDRGYDWAKDPEYGFKVKDWPVSIVIHGDADRGVPLDVSEQMRACLGQDKVVIFVAKGQDHLFELDRFIEDLGPEMDTVRSAVAYLVDIVTTKKRSASCHPSD
ncbi:unnamed protein product [Clonostachys rhizophaga]|uniref:Alpha/beta hydrolase fold-3 domain-containing protein n=1 Tax=Clonostachys rhizophaga TaxID=160324 RepID=A0A9N9VWL5_9HYPO|nr:unnamed protein product [Clonostachys rhizophaga]